MSGTFEDKIAGLAERSRKAVERGSAEEQTKHSVILPFIAALGYDIYELDEVEPEADADIGIKKGEKVDYAIKKGGKIIILIEVKSVNERLANHSSQLFRYFGATDAPIAILTNGKEAWFYSDLKKPNVMDSEPFFKFNFQHNNQNDIEKLSQYQKGIFDIYAIKKTAREIENSKKLEKYIKDKIINPDEDFAHFISKAINGGRLKKHEIFTFQNSIRIVFSKIIDGKNIAPIEIKSETLLQAVNQKTDSTLSTMQTSNLQNSIENYKTLENGFHNTYLRICTEPRKTTFLKCANMIISLRNVREKISTSCVTYFKNKSAFTSIEALQKVLKIGLKIDIEEINDPKGLCIDRKEVRRYGVGNTYIEVDENSDFDYVFELIKQAYDKVNNSTNLNAHAQSGYQHIPTPKVRPNIKSTMLPTGLMISSDSQEFEKNYKNLQEVHDNRYANISQEPRKTTFLNYIKMIDSLGNIEGEVIATCVKFFINGKPFVSILPWKSYLQIGLDMDIAEIRDPYNLCISRIGKKKNGVGDISVNVDEGSNHTAVSELIKQAYNKWR